jgi:hypothetical protein
LDERSYHPQHHAIAQAAPAATTEEVFMKSLSIVAVLLLAAGPAFAQPAKTTAKATKADAEKVVKAISADKAKTKAYCDMAKLGEQIDAAEQKKDQKTVDALSKQMDAMGEKVGPEYISFMTKMQDVDPNSKEGKDINGALEPLEKLCGQ